MSDNSTDRTHYAIGYVKDGSFIMIDTVLGSKADPNTYEPSICYPTKNWAQRDLDNNYRWIKSFDHNVKVLRIDITVTEEN